MSLRNRPFLTGLLAVAVATPLTLFAQGWGDRDYERFNTTYDGRFTFVRLRYDPLPGWSGGGGFWRDRDLKWDHDYPRAERNLMKILDELTAIEPKLAESNILALDDPELFRYPIAYLCEPGYWQVSDSEAASLSSYLQKGGFLIIDDFVENQWFNFVAAMKKVLPWARLVELDPSYPVFHSFFDIESLDHIHPNWGQSSTYYGIFEDNDPTKRLMVIVNYNNDIGDYWEWSDRGFLPIDLSNEAYRLGVNYIVYGMTH